MRAVKPIRLGDNTVYLVELDGTRVLIDTGPDFLGASDSLLESLDGCRPDLVVATHGHLDHAGLGAWWQKQGVPVALHQEDVPLAAGIVPSAAEFTALQEFARECGAPREVVARAEAAIEARRTWSADARRAADYPAPGRDRRWPTGLRYQPFKPRLLLEDVVVPGLELIHLPGHTPGNAVAWVPSEGWLFSGDQLLRGITPTPALQARTEPDGPEWRFRSFPPFLEALRRLGALRPQWCYPGHGEPFTGVSSVIDSHLHLAEQRITRVAELLRSRGPLALYDLAEQLYPRAIRRRFWPIVATVQGFLDVLECRGLVVRTDNRWGLAQAASMEWGSSGATASSGSSQPTSAS